jgi:hypothetical protein
VIIYFASLGMGYMLVEIFLIQRLGEFLSNPTFSVSIVITSMLILSAVGNLVSGFFRKYRDYVVPIAAAGIFGMMLFYIFGLNGVLNAFRGASFGIRIIISLLVIAPAAFLMGIPFPQRSGRTGQQETFTSALGLGNERRPFGNRCSPGQAGDGLFRLSLPAGHRRGPLSPGGSLLPCQQAG